MHGFKVRTVSIDAENPVIYASIHDIIQKIDEDQTFIAYFGYPLCPWCRANIESMLSAARDNGIEEIYYVDVYDVRDTYVLKEGNKIVREKEANSEYYQLLDRLEDVLEDYILQDSDGNEVNINEKRIYAPNVIAIQNGNAVAIAADSERITDPYMELDDEILNELYEIYNQMFGEFKEFN